MHQYATVLGEQLKTEHNFTLRFAIILEQKNKIRSLTWGSLLSFSPFVATDLLKGEKNS